MVARKPRSERDHKRRRDGQNFLVDQGVVERLIRGLQLQPGELVLDLGAGTGALTIPLARAGARVLAVERDPAWVRRLQERLETDHLASHVQIRRADLLTIPLPREPYRVVASPPYGATTALLRRLLDRPSLGPTRADLLLQWEVARKRACLPATTLLSAGWLPWWHFELGERVPRTAFRPIPAIDSGWLTIHRRHPALLPPTMTEPYRAALGALWRG